MVFVIDDRRIAEAEIRYKRMMRDTPYCNPYSSSGPGDLFSSKAGNDKRQVMDVFGKFFSVCGIVREHAAKYGPEDFSGNYGLFCGSVYGDSILRNYAGESAAIPMKDRIPAEKSEMLMVARMLELHSRIASSSGSGDLHRVTRAFMKGIAYETESSLSRFEKSLEQISSEEISVGAIRFRGLEYTGKSSKKRTAQQNPAYQDEDKLPEIKPMNLSGEITLDDVGGFYAAKESAAKLLREIENPKALASFGLAKTKGILLYGPPGTGKTMFAKALGSEIIKIKKKRKEEIFFYEVRLEEILNKYVGESEKSIADLMSRKNSIIFFDEFDSLGGIKGGNEKYMDRITNLIATKLDGIGSNDSNIYLAATNEILSLDPKLLRSGRFDKSIYIGVPGKKELYEIFEKQRNRFIKRSKQQDPNGCYFNSDDLNSLDLNLIAEQMQKKSEELAKQGKVPVAGSDVEQIIKETLSDLFMEYCIKGARRSVTTEHFLRTIAHFSKQVVWKPDYAEDVISK